MADTRRADVNQAPPLDYDLPEIDDPSLRCSDGGEPLKFGPEVDVGALAAAILIASITAGFTIGVWMALS